MGLDWIPEGLNNKSTYGAKNLERVWPLTKPEGGGVSEGTSKTKPQV